MDERIWQDTALAAGETREFGAVSLSRGGPQAMALVSGRLDAALARLGQPCDILGLGAVPQGDRFVIQTGREAGVLVTPEAPDLTEGWHPEGFALTRADDRYGRLRLRGAGAAAVLHRLFALDRLSGSPSAALRFEGRTVLLTGEGDGFSLWVDPADLGHVTALIALAAKAT